MDISIVIPAKNEEEYIGKLLTSIKSQDAGGLEYEIIVADTKSDDKTREIAERFGCMIVEGGIPSRGRNNGAKAAKGEYLLFLDADVLLTDSGFIKKALKEFKEKGLVGASALTALPASEKFYYKLFFRLWDLWNIITQYFNPQAAGYCILALKKYHDMIGGFDETIYFGEDSNYSYRLSKVGKFGILRSVNVYASTRRFRKNGFLKTSSKMIFGGIKRFYKEDRDNEMKYF
jgi:glycosyltransferase involved in cell wall biosynthesis